MGEGSKTWPESESKGSSFSRVRTIHGRTQYSVSSFLLGLSGHCEKSFKHAEFSAGWILEDGQNTLP